MSDEVQKVWIGFSYETADELRANAQEWAKIDPTVSAADNYWEMLDWFDDNVMEEAECRQIDKDYGCEFPVKVTLNPDGSFVVESRSVS